MPRTFLGIPGTELEKSSQFQPAGDDAGAVSQGLGGIIDLWREEQVVVCRVCRAIRLQDHFSPSSIRPTDSWALGGDRKPDRFQDSNMP